MNEIVSRRAAEIAEKDQALVGFAQKPKTDTVSIALRLISLSEIKPKLCVSVPSSEAGERPKQTIRA